MVRVDAWRDLLETDVLALLEIGLIIFDLGPEPVIKGQQTENWVGIHQALGFARTYTLC